MSLTPFSILGSGMAALSANGLNVGFFRERRIMRLPAKLRVGIVLTAIVVLASALANWIAPYPYDQMDFMSRMSPPNTRHWFGTDEFGRDVLSRVLIGAKLSLLMGVLATMLSLSAGVPLGLLAGYRRGHVDEWVMRLMDTLMSLPPIMLGLLVLAVTTPAIWKTVLVVGIVYTPAIVRVIRSVALGLAQEDFVEAARARAERTSYIVLGELLPNAWPVVAVEGSLRITFAIMLGAALSFLGLGAQPPSSDWGVIISAARPFVGVAPWIALAPGLALCITVVGVNLLGEGLRELLDLRFDLLGRA